MFKLPSGVLLDAGESTLPNTRDVVRFRARGWGDHKDQIMRSRVRVWKWGQGGKVLHKC